MRRVPPLLLALVASLRIAAQEVHPEVWPRLPRVPRDPVIEEKVERLLDRMSLEQKIGQIIQPSITQVTPDDVRRYHLGSVLNGGGDWPGDIRKARPLDWLAKADAYWDASMDTTNGRLPIPVLWGADAVHGHNNVIGATIFPHNIALGAANDPELMRRIGEITADEMRVTGLDWDFAPTLAVVQDLRWGRSYESYSDDPAVVARLGTAFIEGLQSRGIVATAKHYVGDGGTAGGKDQGDNVASESVLRDVHARGYMAAVPAGVLTVMASYNSWHGQKLHGHRGLLTEVLKERMGFDGFVIGDWNGHAQVPGCSNASCAQAFNAGVDMFMVPEEWKALYENTLAQVKSGEISAARLDDAVRRILRVKFRAGLFDAGRPSSRPLAGKLERFGSAAHREVARRAVRQSLVLLKNERGTLPLAPKQHVVVMGDGAHNIPKQTGGWTITWQGDGNSNADFPGAMSIWDGIRGTVQAAGGRALLSVDGVTDEKPDVAIVVYGESPYAEMHGDRETLQYRDDVHLELLRRLRREGVRVVSVFLSGRPLRTDEFIDASDAFVAAWLPGTEGGGVADVLFGRAKFRGKLPFPWP